MIPPPTSACVCASGQSYAHCCGALHAGLPAPDAARLMRSRYSAYALELRDYLLATWQASTRPAALEFEPETRWLGLDLRRHEVTGADAALVEFVARLRRGGASAQRMHEISRFVREQGRWLYVDGDFVAPAARWRTR